jgi:diadenosine tetraphosphate (Ap4A) HIT family hydrolase
MPGYTIVVSRGRHVVDLAELNDEEASGYWLEVVRVARALRHVFEPLHANCTTLGNMLPHLHTNVVLRYFEDPAPEADPPLVGGAEVPDDDFRAQASALRSRLQAETRFESNAEGTT